MIKALLKKIAGNYTYDPSSAKLSSGARKLIEESFAGIPGGKFIDSHVHVFGMNTEKTGCWVNPSILKWNHPVDHMKVNVFIDASGIKNLEFADDQYMDRLDLLANDFPGRGRFVLLPLDKCYDKDGVVNESDTKFYVPNEYVYKIYEESPEMYIPAVSIHPYRRDAVKELDKWARQGIRLVKWIPNTMGIDPSDPLCDPFYEKMKEYDMVLLGHAGKESAMEVVKFKTYGNPLHYRRPLNNGVKVIIAHCAGLGSNIDFDCPHKRPVKNYKLFLRLMKDERYRGLVFGDISGLTQINRMGKPLRAILKKPYMHERLINGSDYPLPAVNAAMSTKGLVSLGYITREEGKYLNEIYKKNPLLFDFILKRTIKHPKRGTKFKVSVFMDHPALNLTKGFVMDREEKNS